MAGPVAQARGRGTLAETQCPGCGGRNLEAATVCDWCGRSLVEGQRSWPMSRRLLVALAILLVLAALAVQQLVSSGARAP